MRAAMCPRGALRKVGMGKCDQRVVTQLDMYAAFFFGRRAG